MEKALKIGILRETKNPPDRRVPLTPFHIVALRELYPHIEFYIQPSPFRCYSDDEYTKLNIQIKEDLSDCDILMGVKEIDKQTILPGKTYLFFAHVGKGQSSNIELLNELLSKGVRLIDYEYLKTEKDQRVVAFGKWAGIVGAYNALRALGIKSGKFKLTPAHQCSDINEMWEGLKHVQLKSGLKILITGEGRVAQGALSVFDRCNIVPISIEDFLLKEFDVPVVCKIGPKDYTQHRTGQPFTLRHFMKHVEEYESIFLPFTRVTDVLVAGHYWNPSSPVFFSREDMKRKDFRISVIADISCDLNGPIPSTIRATTITDPFFGYNPFLHREEPPFTNPYNITVMSIDNLPGELPRDASYDFGNQLMENAMHCLISGSDNQMIDRATITRDGALTAEFSYLSKHIKQ